MWRTGPTGRQGDAEEQKEKNCLRLLWSQDWLPIEGGWRLCDGSWRLTDGGSLQFTRRFRMCREGGGVSGFLTKTNKKGLIKKIR